MGIGKIIRAVRKENIVAEYIRKERMIDHNLYQELKRKRICNDCKKTFLRPLQIDHIIALKNGGQSIKSNLQVLCTTCHNKKTKLENKKL